LSGSLLFETGKSDLLRNAQEKLSQVAKVLKEDTRQIRIVGHTDATGSDETNKELSRRRAEAVRQFLSIRGVPEDRMTIEGVGSTQPVADNKTAAGRATNRRVEIVLANDNSPAGSQGSQGSQGSSSQGSQDTTPKTGTP
jgi:outer membrane protein OmpA-like peptidoglycan-associated protein